LRYICCKISNNFWMHSYDCIRKLYPEVLIVIVDDMSPWRTDLKKPPERDNYKIIYSEKKGGELLPYHILHQHQFAKKAIIIQDSVFLQKKIPHSLISGCDTSLPLWVFRQYCAGCDGEDGPPSVQEKNIIEMINGFDKESKLISFFSKKKLWKPYFGGMSIIALDFLNNILKQDNFINYFMEQWKADPSNFNRKNRLYIETVIGLVLSFYGGQKLTVYGEITGPEGSHGWFPWPEKGKSLCGRFGQKYTDYLKNNNKKPIEKIWACRGRKCREEKENEKINIVI